MNAVDPLPSRPLTIVTGGSRGLGAAIAVRLAAAGHDLVLGYLRDAAAAESVARRCREHGAACVTLAGDVTDPGDVGRLFDAAERAGTLTGVVCNAGAATSLGPLAGSEPAALARDLDVNLLAPVLCAREASRRLGERGAIVIISSAAAQLGSPGTYVHYAAAKAGVEALAVGLSKELGPRGIRVNAVSPGTLWTDFHADPQRPAAVAAAVPLGRAGRAEEIAGAVAWLLSDDASYTTGAVLKVSGGL